jgi:pimeloyl-ACP methyl ester carboxylesterase
MSEAFQLKMQEDRFIRGDFFSSHGETRGTLVICHGFKGFKDWGMFPHAGKELADGLDVVLFNFSHNGVGEDLENFTELEKFAKETYSRDLEDLDFLLHTIEDGKLPVKRQPLTAPIFLLGHSRGAAISLIHAFDHPTKVAGVISWNGVTQVDIYGEKEKEEMRKIGRAYIQNARTKQEMPLDRSILEDMEAHKIRFDILERVKTSIVPIVLIQGTEDSKRLREGSERMTKAREDVVWHQVEGGNHTFNAVHPFKGETPALKDAIRLTKDWIGQTLKIRNERG